MPNIYDDFILGKEMRKKGEGNNWEQKNSFLPNFQEINLSLKSLKFKAKALRQIKSSTEKEKKGERLR